MSDFDPINDYEPHGFSADHARKVTNGYSSHLPSERPMTEQQPTGNDAHEAAREQRLQQIRERQSLRALRVSQAFARNGSGALAMSPTEHCQRVDCEEASVDDIDFLLQALADAERQRDAAVAALEPIASVSVLGLSVFIDKDTMLESYIDKVERMKETAIVGLQAVLAAANSSQQPSQRDDAGTAGA